MVNMVNCRINLLYFGMTLLYYWFILRPSIIFCLFSGYHFSIKSYISLAVSAVFWIAVLEGALSASVANCLALSRLFWLI